MSNIQLPGPLKRCMNFGEPHEKTSDCVRWGEFETEPFHTPEELAELNKDFLPERAGREGDSQDLPTVNDRPFVQDAVIADIEARKQVGIKRYGTPLQPFNGRNAILDAYEEVLDLACYLKQLLIEQKTEVDIPCAICAVEEGRDVFHQGPGDGVGEYHRVVDGL